MVDYSTRPHRLADLATRMIDLVSGNALAMRKIFKIYLGSVLALGLVLE